MNNQNKVLMSLLTASISALAAAPALAKNTEAVEDKSASNTQKGEVIDIMSITPVGLNAAQQAFKDEMRAQVDVMLSKKAPIMKIYESISIVVDNYGKGDSSIKKEVFKDLNLAQSTDSTSIGGGSPTYYGSTTTYACHAICHSACHSACHGARGWR